MHLPARRQYNRISGTMNKILASVDAYTFSGNFVTAHGRHYFECRFPRKGTPHDVSGLGELRQSPLKESRTEPDHNFLLFSRFPKNVDADSTTSSIFL